MGISEDSIWMCEDELEAARYALGQIKKGDLLILLSHTHYEQVLSLLEGSQKDI